MIKIKISKDFSDTPGGRYIKEGNFSGEAFRNEILLPRFIEAEQKNEKIEVDFDDCYGFGTSFLEEAFGGLVRECRKKGVYDRLIIVSKEDETIPDLIKKYIMEAEKNK